MHELGTLRLNASCIPADTRDNPLNSFWATPPVSPPNAENVIDGASQSKARKQADETLSPVNKVEWQAVKAKKNQVPNQ